MTIEGVALILAVTALVASLVSLREARRIEKSVPRRVEAIANRAYSKAQQALENSVEALQIAKDEVPEKPNKLCNSKYWQGDAELTCSLPKYPGHETHSNFVLDNVK